MARAERAVLEALNDGPRPGSELPIPGDVHRERLLLELTHKEKVIRETSDGFERTERGQKMLEAWS